MINQSCVAYSAIATVTYPQAGVHNSTQTMADSAVQTDPAIPAGSTVQPDPAVPAVPADPAVSTVPADAAAKLGSWVRIWGITYPNLPHPDIDPMELSPVLAVILREGVSFIDSAAPKSGEKPVLWKNKKDKSSPDSTARVTVSERVVDVAELKGLAEQAPTAHTKLVKETWMCRRSVHEDAAVKGTASWAEFERCFRDEHAEAESAFTPNVVAHNEAFTWRCVHEIPAGGETWDRFTLKIVEMRHNVGKPLQDRTFVVLQMVAAVVGKQEFIVVSIPIPDFGQAHMSKLAKEENALIAVYVSVERVRKMDDGRIEWLMATASDAGGILPMWVQNIAMPGVIWKDVPLFLKWIASERQRNTAVGGPNVANSSEAPAGNGTSGTL